MTSPNKPTSKPSMVAKMSVKPIWRKKPNLCNTSNVLNATSPMPKPLTPHHEPSQENNHPNQALPNPYIKDTPTSPQVVLHPPLSISPINSHVAHTQSPPQSDNQTQHTPPLSSSRESLIDDIYQLQDLSNLLAMHLSQQQNNIPSSPYSRNLPHTLNINQIETHVGYCPLTLKKEKRQTNVESVGQVVIIRKHVLLSLEKGPVIPKFACYQDYSRCGWYGAAALHFFIFTAKPKMSDPILHCCISTYLDSNPEMSEHLLDVAKGLERKQSPRSISEDLGIPLSEVRKMMKLCKEIFEEGLKALDEIEKLREGIRIVPENKSNQNKNMDEKNESKSLFNVL
ncbi:hypothetical protein Tco_1091844 [Tanacetum coccineum]|uniref:FRIGIDA-like protein n=1 Tax=Tanacetum coccineum TaxID=301880 RepID=A0ABQ5I9D1_9ASTR